MKFKKIVGLLAALLVLAFLSVALVVHSEHPLNTLVWALSAFSFVSGVVTLSYRYPLLPAAQGVTPPTAQQVYGLGAVSVQVFFADGDLTSGPITHNFGLSVNELADLFPAVIITPTAGGTVFPGFTISKASNTITIAKASASVGSGGTFDVIILRPHTNQGGGSSGNR